jgi:hypothetical protein
MASLLESLPFPLEEEISLIFDEYVPVVKLRFESNINLLFVIDDGYIYKYQIVLCL